MKEQNTVNRNTVFLCVIFFFFSLLHESSYKSGYSLCHPVEERSPSGWEPLDIDLSSAPTTVQQCFGGGVMYGEGDASLLFLQRQHFTFTSVWLWTSLTLTAICFQQPHKSGFPPKNDILRG